MSNKSSSTGITFGCLIAVVASWSVNVSVFWAIVHGFCSWFYVIYWVFAYGIK